MKTEILFAGFGGQGILFMGKTLAQSAMAEGKQVTFLPSYGPEMRSGTSNCGVVISDDTIASPVINQFDILVVMNQPSYLKFADQVRPGGFIVYNSSLVNLEAETNPDINFVGNTFTQSAVDLGDVRVASMIALGALIKTTNTVKLQTLLDEVKGLTAKRPELVAINQNALMLGHEFEY